MFEEYKEKLSLRSRIIMDDISKFERRYRNLDSILNYFIQLTELLKEDYFLLFDSNLICKVQNINEILSFCYPTNENIQKLRKQATLEVNRQKRLLDSSDSLEIISGIITQEIEDRNIPREYKIGKCEVLEMYQRDFENYIAMTYQGVSIENLSFFYYLTTVHKIYKKYPSYVHLYRKIIFYMMIQLRSSLLALGSYDALLEKYFLKTEECIYSEKIIKFPPR